MPPIPTKQDFLAAISLALATALTEIGRIFDASPDAEAAKQRVLDYLSGKLAPEVITQMAQGGVQELVAAFATGVSEVEKPPADLA